MFFTKHNFLEVKDGTGNSKFLTDITEVVNVPEKFKNSNNCDQYMISDGDTPESLATALYDDSKLSWVILLANGITNVYENWPLSTEAFNEMIEKKYGSTISIFLQLGSIKKYDLSIGSIIKSLNNDTAQIVNWDASLSKLSVKTISGEFKNNTGKVFLEDDTEVGVIARVVNYEAQSLHHFEQNGTWIDPLLGNLQGYLSGTNIDVVTNEEYEASVNNKKREIFLPKKEFAKDIQNNYSRMI
jgi:hypothetical protein